MLYESQYYGICDLGDVVSHHGIKGQKWGVRRFQNEDGSLTPAGRERYGTNGSNNSTAKLYAVTSPKDLSSHMRSFKYSEYTKLKSPEEVERTGSGSCHDQVMYEYTQLKAMGKKPKALFMMEYDERSGQGGMTHSAVYWKENGKVNYIDNASGRHEGIKQFKNEKALTDYFKQTHNKTNEFGDNKKYPQFDIDTFTPDKHTPGETLQEFVDGVWKEQSERRR